MRRRSAWLLAAALCAGQAAAHPLHEVVQGAYLTLGPGEVRLQLDLSPGPEVAGVVLKALDVNADRRISEAEARAYGVAVLKEQALTVDGRAAPWTIRKVVVPAYQAVAAEGATIVIHATAARA